jgi:hypothetical protein
MSMKLRNFIFLAAFFTFGAPNAFSFTSFAKDKSGTAPKEKDSFYLVFIASEGFSENSRSYPSAWVWNEDVMNLIESHVPFIFRTRKSAKLDELKILVNINNRGKFVSFEVLTEEADRGLVERIEHLLKRIPDARPVPGFSSYEATAFELVFSKFTLPL